MGFNCVVNSLHFVYFQVNCGLNIALERLGTRLVYNYDLLIAAKNRNSQCLDTRNCFPSYGTRLGTIFTEQR